MSSTSPLTLLVVVVALLATTITAIPFSYPYSSPYSCGSYASRLYNYYSGRPLYMCPTFYPTPYTGGCHTGRCAPYVGSGTGAGPINLNNMNKVNIGPVPAPASQATPIAEDTTTGAAPATTDEASMAAQSEEESTGLGKLQKRCYKCIAYKMRKVVYALPSCMGFRSGACPYSRKTIAPVAVPYAVPASNNIMINDRNKVVVNMPAAQPQRQYIQVNVPTQHAAPAPIYMAPLQPVILTVTQTLPSAPTPTPTPVVPVQTEVSVPTETTMHDAEPSAIPYFETTQPAPATETAETSAIPYQPASVIQTVEMPASTVTMMIPTFPAPQVSVIVIPAPGATHCAGCLEAAPCDMKMGSCVSAY